MYKILFIDEVEADIHRFQRYVHKQNVNKQFIVIEKIPSEDLNEFVEDIINDDIDAIIADYQLAEYMPSITYTGVELIEKILSRKPNFPCFVLTSHDDQAVSTSTDVNMVYVKGLMTKEDNVKITFLERVKNQIEHYKSKINNAQNRLNELVNNSKKRNLTAREEEELLHLDDFLEKSLNQESKIPVQLKRKSTLNDLHKLIENTDKLLGKLEADNVK